MIEPKSTVCESPVHDHYTALARKALRLAKAGTVYKGRHTCACGVESGSIELRVDGVLTNSLIVHYVRDHRSEVPAAELRKLKTLMQGRT